MNNLIVSVRTKLNMKQCELAGRTHISPGNLSRYEKGWSRPSLETAKKICKELGESIEVIFPNYKFEINN